MSSHVGRTSCTVLWTWRTCGAGEPVPGTQSPREGRKRFCWRCPDTPLVGCSQGTAEGDRRCPGDQSRSLPRPGGRTGIFSAEDPPGDKPVCRSRKGRSLPSLRGLFCTADVYCRGSAAARPHRQRHGSVTAKVVCGGETTPLVGRCSGPGGSLGGRGSPGREPRFLLRGPREQHGEVEGGANPRD